MWTLRQIRDTVVGSRFGRFSIVGSTGAGISHALVFVLTSVCGVWYQTSSQIGFVTAAILTFIGQKWWTYRNEHWWAIVWQATLYFWVRWKFLPLIVPVVAFMVERMGIWYVFAQIVGMALLAIPSYFINIIVFWKPKPKTTRKEAVV